MPGTELAQHRDPVTFWYEFPEKHEVFVSGVVHGVAQKHVPVAKNRPGRPVPPHAIRNPREIFGGR